MVVLLQSNKNLIISKDTRLYQGENCVDKVITYIPTTYNDLDLSQFTVAMNIENAGNKVYLEVLESQESDKDGYLMYQLPIDTKFTELAGTVKFNLSILRNNEETGNSEVMHTNSVEKEIMTWADYFKYIDDSSLSSLDNKILELGKKVDELKAVADEIKDSSPDDLQLNDTHLSLSHDGEPMGQGVELPIEPLVSI